MTAGRASERVRVTSRTAWHWHLLGFWEGYMSIFNEVVKYAVGLTTSFGALYGIVFAINSMMHAPNHAVKAVLACVVLHCPF